MARSGIQAIGEPTRLAREKPTASIYMQLVRKMVALLPWRGGRLAMACQHRNGLPASPWLDGLPANQPACAVRAGARNLVRVQPSTAEQILSRVPAISWPAEHVGSVWPATGLQLLWACSGVMSWEIST
ncbi:hypothetical protein SAMD00023353_5200350 [Rosellinia necatrix]|uniref:Uncharacterized protein n=1 Tax=Rosellinia necatrix TaxID=77044 RepID=A0A1W2TQJ6_ROSNE|nr:hypothetical protein SAMD00023353_5200350 [Rosellinia necatrix]